LPRCWQQRDRRTHEVAPPPPHPAGAGDRGPHGGADTAMRIVYTAIRYPPAPGGMEEQVGAIATAMAARGHEVSVYTSDLEQHIDFKRLRGVPAREVRDGVRVTRCFSLHPPHTTWPVQPGLPLALAGAQADLVHAYGFLYFPMLATHVVAQHKRWPVVFNPIVDRNAILRHPRYARWLGERMIQSPVTVTDTAWAVDVLRELGFAARRFEVVPPGVDIAAYDGVDGAFFSAARRAGERPLLFAGRIASGKGLDVLLRALPAIRVQFPAVRLHVIGTDFGYLAAARALAGELALGDGVTWHGYVARRDLISAYKGAELLVLPSRYEEFGMVIAEAWAAGTAVVAAASTAIPFVVDDGVDGLLFPTDDVAACAARVCDLLADDAKRRAFGLAGQQKVRDRYAWPVIFDQLESIYRSL